MLEFLVLMRILLWNEPILKFIKRFQTLEKLALEPNLNLAEMSLEEMDILWEEAKKTV